MSIAERWAAYVAAMGIPPHVAAAMWPTFIAGFAGALKALGELDGHPHPETAMLAWHREITDGLRRRPH